MTYSVNLTYLELLEISVDSTVEYEICWRAISNSATTTDILLFTTHSQPNQRHADTTTRYQTKDMDVVNILMEFLSKFLLKAWKYLAFKKGPFTNYVMPLRWVGGRQNINIENFCKAGDQ